MFVWVPFTKLIIGKKYKIIGQYEECIVIFKGYCRHCLPLRFTIVKSKRYSGDVLFSIDREIYEFLPQNPQWKMERRSVNMIIRRLIGDDNFEW